MAPAQDAVVRGPLGGGAPIALPRSARTLESFGTENAGTALAFSSVHGLSYAVFLLPGGVLLRMPPAHGLHELVRKATQLFTG